MSEKKVELSPYNPEWLNFFNQERIVILKILGDWAIDIHHVGSTSIPGLAAKPIVDIMPTVNRLEDVHALRRSFEAHGFIWKGENGIAGRLYVVRDHPDSTEHLTHVHIFEVKHFE